MNSFMKKIGNVDNFWCKMIFLILPFFGEIPLLMDYIVPVLKVGIIFACIYIACDFFTNRNIFKMRYMGLVVVFLGALAISTALNLNNSMVKMNIIELGYTFAVLLALFPTREYDEERVKKEITIINCTLILLTTAASVISIVMFLLQYKSSITINDYTYPIGVYQGRLVGLYKNSIYPTSAYGIWCSISQLLIVLKKDTEKSKKIISTVLLSLCILINMIFVILQNSRGLFIGCIVALVCVAVFGVNSLDTEKFFKDKKILKLTAVLVSTVLCVAVFNVAITGIREVASYSVIKIAQSNDNLGGIDNIIVDDENGDEGLDFEREEPEEYGFATGRGYIWGQGVKRFLEKPIFGHAPYSLSGQIETYPGSTEKVSHFHNVFVHTLVSCGAVGFVVFLGLCVMIALQALKFLFNEKGDRFRLALGVVGLIIFLLVINLADTTILFQTKHSGFVFFIYLGYLVAITNDDKEKLVDKPIRAIDNLLAKFFKKV